MQINDIINEFEKKTIIIVGDVMLDHYILGKVSRISPEAPVPIVSYQQEESRLGGAANVALNIVAMGAKAIICSVIGRDKDGEKLKELVKSQNISDEGLIASPNRITTKKTRIIGNHQQLLRIDAEQTNDITPTEEEELLAKVNELLKNGADALIFEDYNKGTLSENLIKSIISLCLEHNVPTCVDPKLKNFLAYKNVTLFKPNLKELNEGLGTHVEANNKNAFENAVADLETKLNNEISFVTLSEHGVYIKNKEEQHFIKAHQRNIADVSGAGDTVISIATLCLTIGLPIKQIASLANLAGGLVCEKPGVVCIDKNEFYQEVVDLF